MTTFKNIIIGFGKGGKTLAKTLAVKGEQVLLIEASAQMYGGTCINVGCIPSKALITSAEKGRSFVEGMDKKTTLIQMLRQKNFHMIDDEAQAEVWTGTARFVSNHELEVTMMDGTVRRVTGERIFINTGAVSNMPNISGLENNPYVLTSTEALSLPTLPEHIVMIGAGYIGLEFASMFTTYGAKVTVLDLSEQFIPREEPEVAAMVRSDLEAAGVQFRLGVTNILVEGNRVSYEFEGEQMTEEVSAILVAAGRKPNTANLGLENTDIIVTAQGAVEVDDQLRTKVDNVWAIGDVKGGPQFTYVSLDDFRIIKDQLWGNGTRKVSDRRLIPYTVFLETPLSHVGYTEAAARQAGLEVQVFTQPMAAVPKAHILGNTKGMFKIIVDQATQAIVGATHYGIESQEVINILALAVKTAIPYTELRDMLFTHPTVAEALNDVLK